MLVRKWACEARGAGGPVGGDTCRITIRGMFWHLKALPISAVTALSTIVQGHARGALISTAQRGTPMNSYVPADHNGRPGI